MKLSFSTLGCPEWDFNKVVTEAGRLGFSGIELRGVNGKLRAEEIPELFPENLAATKAFLKAKNVELVGFGTSASFHNEKNAAAGLDECRKAINVCSAAGIPSIRVFGDQLPDKNDIGGTIAFVADSIAKLCEYAEDKAVEVRLEVHGEFNTIETIGRVIDRCRQYKSFGLIWDIEHSDRAYGDNWRPFYELIRPYVKHIHVKDYIRLENGAYTLCLPGEGDIPIRGIVTTLLRDGFDGFFSLEWEKKWHPELPEPDAAFPIYCDFMREIEKTL